MLTIGISTVALSLRTLKEVLKYLIHIPRICLGCPIHLGRALCFTLKTWKTLYHINKFPPFERKQAEVVPFEIKDVFVSDCQIELPSVYENQKSDDMLIEVHLNETSKRKRKCSAETPEEKEKGLIAKCQYEKNKKANESKECKQKKGLHNSV